MKHFLSTVDWTKEELQDILDYSKYLKTNRFQDSLKNKSVGLVFFLDFLFNNLISLLLES